MDDSQLPAELERLERLLMSAERPEPSAALRGRVLRGAQCEVRRRRVFVLACGVLITTAATVLVGVGFAYLFVAAFSDGRAATQDQAGVNRPAPSPERMPPVVSVYAPPGNVVTLGPAASTPLPAVELARRIRELSPEISVDESMRRAVAVLAQFRTMSGGRSSLDEQLRILRVEEASKAALEKKGD